MSLDFPAAETGSTDPRIKRTRIHVIDTARQMLAEHTEPLSFTSVADRAFVARQTLYKHWGTIDNLLAETIKVDPIGEEADYEGLDVAGRAAVYLRKLVDQFDFGTASAFAAMLASSAYEPATHANLIRLDKHLYKMFIDRVGMASHDQFFEIVAPVMFMNLIGAVPGDGLIQSCSERAAQLIH